MKLEKLRVSSSVDAEGEGRAIWDLIDGVTARQKALELLLPHLVSLAKKKGILPVFFNSDISIRLEAGESISDIYNSMEDMPVKIKTVKERERQIKEASDSSRKDSKKKKDDKNKDTPRRDTIPIKNENVNKDITFEEADSISYSTPLKEVSMTIHTKNEDVVINDDSEDSLDKKRGKRKINFQRNEGEAIN